MITTLDSKCREGIYIVSVLTVSFLQTTLDTERFQPILLFTREELSIAEDTAKKYTLLLAEKDDNNNDNNDHNYSFHISRKIEPYLALLRAADVSFSNLVFELLYKLCARKMYNAASRIYLKTFSLFTGLNPTEFRALESNMALFLNSQSSAFQRILSENPSDPSFQGSAPPACCDNTMKYTKIAFVSVFIGLAAALTGGLAAPAIAASSLGIASAVGAGAAGMAAVSTISVGTMASLFGAVGTGVAGYKMHRRMKGLHDFDFEAYNKGRMAVCIVVSGWMRSDASDYQRVFGVIPSTLPLKERLYRYFRQHAPERVEDIPTLCKQFAGHESDLFEGLRKEFGFDPTKLEHLMTPPTEIEVSSDLWKLFGALLQETSSSSSSPSFSSTSSGEEQQRAFPVSSLHLSDDELPHQMPVDYSEKYFPPQVESDDQTSRKKTSPRNGLTANRVTSAPVEATLAELKTGAVPRDELFWNYNDVSLSTSHEFHLLKWEVDLQMQIGDSVPRLFRTLGTNAAVNTLISSMALGALNAAISYPLAVLKLADRIDSVWSLAELRADLAGIELANAIIHRYKVDKRAITLIGYSMGARLLFSCLTQLHKVFRASVEAGGSGEDAEKMIEDVVLLGAPITSDVAAWKAVRQVVNGRLINGYSVKDVVLGFMYRTENLKLTAAGIWPIASAARGVENVDLSALINYHGDYCTKMKVILDLLHIDQQLGPNAL